MIAGAIEKKSFFSQDLLEQKVAAAMQQRVAAGIADTIEGLQPPEPPPFDQQFVNTMIEVLWKYVNQDTGETVLIWSAGKVKRVADGMTDKRTKRCTTLLKAGAVLWAWEADPAFDEPAGEQWLVLIEKKFNKQVHYGWRLLSKVGDSAESLLPSAAPQPERAARPQNCRRAAE